jgi:hypothetical protein
LTNANDTARILDSDAATSTLRYLRNAANLVIQYRAADSESNGRVGYTDSNLGGYPDDRKSTCGPSCTLPEVLAEACSQAAPSYPLNGGSQPHSCIRCLSASTLSATSDVFADIRYACRHPMCLPIYDALANIRCACRYTIYSPTSDVLADIRYARQHAMCLPICKILADIRHGR